MENSEYVYLYLDIHPTKHFGKKKLLQEFMSLAFNITFILYVEDSYVLTHSTEYTQ